MGRIVGIENIQRYLAMSEATVMDMIHHEGLPAKKVSGIWEVDQAELDRWKSPDPKELRGDPRRRKDTPSKSGRKSRKASTKRRGSGRRK